MNEIKTIRELKKGEYFTLKPIEYPTEKQVYIRGDYDRSEKKYEITRFDDINAFRFVKPTTKVYTDFIF